MDSIEKLEQLTGALSEPEREIDFIFKSSIVLLCIAGEDGFFKKVSPSWVSLLGWDEAELLSHPWLWFVHPGDIQATKDIYAGMLNGIPATKFKNRYRTKDGSYKTILWHAPSFSPSGISYSTATDITEVLGAA